MKRREENRKEDRRNSTHVVWESLMENVGLLLKCPFFLKLCLKDKYGTS